MSKSEAVTHFGEVFNAHPGPHRILGDQAFRVTKSYINNLSVPVTVGIRNGAKFILPSIPDCNCNKFIARTEMMLSRRVANDFIRFFSLINDKSSMELQALKEAYSCRITTSTIGSVNLILDYKVSIQEIQRRGGSIYFHEIDDVISLLPIDEAPLHPYSEFGRENLATDRITGEDSLNFYYEIEIIDNVGKLSDRYVNIHNEIFRVTPRKHKNKRDGIYIVSSAAAFGESGPERLVQKHFSLESSEVVNFLFSSYEEALNRGNFDAARKEELTRLEHQIQTEKLNLAKLKNAHEKEMLEMDQKYKVIEADRLKQQAEIDLLRAEKEMRNKLEQMRIKDMYEERSYRRKDESELMKHVPAAIMGIGTIFMMIKTFMPKK